MGEESFFRKGKKEFCEGCSDLGLYNSDIDACDVCAGPNVYQISSEKFDNSMSFDQRIGHYLECIEATSQLYNEKSSAGGLATSLIKSLIEKREVDYVLSVGFDSFSQEFCYQKFDKVEDLVKQQRSAYYPVKLSKAIEIIESEDGSCAITGIPTAIKAIEIRRNTDREFQRKVRFTIGLVSGGIKIENYTDYLCRKAGKEDGFADLSYLSYRDKPIEGNYWGDNYFFRARTKLNEFTLKSDKIKMNWPSGLLKSFASDFCDDTFNIAADITIMDGWLPRYKNTRGVSLAVLRNKIISRVITENEDLSISGIGKEDIVASQIGGLRHKTIGLKARIRLYKFFGSCPPTNLSVPNEAAPLIVYVEQFLRLRASFISRKIYAQRKSFVSVDRKLSSYIFFLRVVNKLKHKFFSR